MRYRNVIIKPKKGRNEQQQQNNLRKYYWSNVPIFTTNEALLSFWVIDFNCKQNTPTSARVYIYFLLYLMLHSINCYVKAQATIEIS